MQSLRKFTTAWGPKLSEVDEIPMSPNAPQAAPEALEPLQQSQEPLVIVILGWPNDLPDLMKMLDRFAPSHSVVHIMAQKPEVVWKAALEGRSSRWSSFQVTALTQAISKHVKTCFSLHQLYLYLPKV
jgi:hypothetical protein